MRSWAVAITLSALAVAGIWVFASPTLAAILGAGFMIVGLVGWAMLAFGIVDALGTGPPRDEQERSGSRR